MGSSVVAGNIQLASLVHNKGNRVAYVDNALSNLAHHNNSAVGQLLSSGNIDYAGGTGNRAQVAQLTAALSMESGYIANHSNLGAVGSTVNGLCIMSRIQLHDSSFCSSLINLQGSDLDAGGIVNHGATFLIVTSIARHLALYLKGSVKASLIHGQALLFQNLRGQLPGEAKGIVQLKGGSAIQLGLASFLQLSDLLVQELATLL